MQEFPERVRIFKRNCETVRNLNAVKKEGYKVSLCLSLPSQMLGPRFCLGLPSTFITPASRLLC